MKRLLALVFAITLCGFTSAQMYGKMPAPAGAQRAVTRAPGSIRIDQQLGAMVPKDVTIFDEQGKERTVGSYLGDKPVVLMLVFYRCMGICSEELTNMARTLKGFRSAEIGKHFEVLTVSIHPKEDAELARASKSNYVKMARQPGAAEGWHFTTGDYKNVRRLADAVGYKYEYDEGAGNVVHPAGIVVLSPQGKIIQYMMGTEYPGQLLLNALNAAAKEKVGFRQEAGIMMACVNIDPLTGKRTINVLNTVKVLATITVLTLVVSILLMNRSSRRRLQRGGRS